MSQLRIFHLSDVHVCEPHPGWRFGDCFTKRVTGRLHLLRRGWKFDQARHVLDRFVADVRAAQPDAVVFSGDASALGFASEVRAASRCLHVSDSSLPPAVAVPGNHDHYVRTAVSEGAFEAAFQPWLQGQRIDRDQFPFVRDIAGVQFICVNSSKPNWLPWDACGAVGAEQLGRLDRLLSEMPIARRVLVTHYPYCRADGQPEQYWHGLRDRETLANLMLKHRIRVWLCGHIHSGFVLPPTDAMPFAVVCAGSATQLGRASYLEISIADIDLQIRCHRFDSAEDRFVPTDEVHSIPRLFEIHA